MPTTPFGAIVARKYTSDDGTDYAIGVPLELANAASLVAPLAGTIPFCSIWQCRYLYCSVLFRPGIEPTKWTVKVPIQALNPLWVSGAGAVISIGGFDYVILSCQGERRID